MSLDTKDQKNLHLNRKKQLDKADDYVHKFISCLDKEKSYNLSGCPTCNSISYDETFEKNGGKYVYCENCDHIYLSNILKEEKLMEFYAKYPNSCFEWYKNESDFFKKIYQKGIDSIKKACPSKFNSLLDIGCASGYFARVANLNGFIAKGIEPNDIESEYAIKEGINVVGKTIDDLSEKDLFDVMTMWDVLEHIPNPIEFLIKLKPYLNQNGLVFVQVPTSDSLAAKVLQKNCNMFDGLTHLTLFGKKSLDLAFSKAGYEMISYETVISETHAISNYLSYAKDPYLDTPKNLFKSKLIDPDFIINNNLGYKIQAIFKKIK